MSPQVVATVGYILSAKMHERSGTIPPLEVLSEKLRVPIHTLINAEIHVIKAIGFSSY